MIDPLFRDLERVRQKMKSFSTLRIFAPILREPAELQACQEILDHRMDMYVLLLRNSIMQPPGEKRRLSISSPWEASRGRRSLSLSNSVRETQNYYNSPLLFQHPAHNPVTPYIIPDVMPITPITL